MAAAAGGGGVPAGVAAAVLRRGCWCCGGGAAAAVAPQIKKGPNGATMPTDEDDQDGHFFYNHPERGVYFAA